MQGSSRPWERHKTVWPWPAMLVPVIVTAPIEAVDTQTGVMLWMCGRRPVLPAPDITCSTRPSFTNTSSSFHCNCRHRPQVLKDCRQIAWADHVALKQSCPVHATELYSAAAIGIQQEKQEAASN